MLFVIATPYHVTFSNTNILDMDKECELSITIHNTGRWIKRYKGSEMTGVTSKQFNKYTIEDMEFMLNLEESWQLQL